MLHNPESLADEGYIDFVEIVRPLGPFTPWFAKSAVKDGRLEIVQAGRRRLVGVASYKRLWRSLPREDTTIAGAAVKSRRGVA